jgi:hypothetical protein
LGLETHFAYVSGNREDDFKRTKLELVLAFGMVSADPVSNSNPVNMKFLDFGWITTYPSLNLGATVVRTVISHATFILVLMVISYPNK